MFWAKIFLLLHYDLKHIDLEHIYPKFQVASNKLKPVQNSRHFLLEHTDLRFVDWASEVTYFH